MKKIILTFALLSIAFSVVAESPDRKPSNAGFITNKFWDNWEISANIGVGAALSNRKDLGALGDRFGFEGNISATKWLHPITGLRLQLQGGQFSTYNQQKGLQKWPYIFVHTDLMINFSNWVGGYREDRAYYAVPYFGFGYMAANFTDKSIRKNEAGRSHNLAASFGLLNKFRISPSVDFNLELKALFTQSRIAPTQLNGNYLFGFSATAGFTYRFNRRGWTRCNAQQSAEQIRVFQQTVAEANSALEAANAENLRLNNALRSAEAAAVKDEKPAPVVEKSSQSVIFYNIGTAKLTAQESTRLELIADRIKRGSADRVYVIQGHADRQTGTAELNKRLSEKRAKVVYEFLISKGVNPKQLSYEGAGDTKNPFPVQKANRAAVIE